MVTTFAHYRRSFAVFCDIQTYQAEGTQLKQQQHYSLEIIL